MQLKKEIKPNQGKTYHESNNTSENVIHFLIVLIVQNIGKSKWQFCFILDNYCDKIKYIVAQLVEAVEYIDCISTER